MKQIIVKLDDKELIISELPIGKYAELIKALKKLPKHVVGFDKLDVDQTLERLPEVLNDALPECLEILSIATGLKKEELEVYGLHKIVKIILAVVEVNDYRDVYDSIKKAMARPNNQDQEIVTT